MGIVKSGVYSLFMAWLRQNRHKSGNNHIVGIDKVMVPPTDTSSLIARSQQSCSEQSSVSKVVLLQLFVRESVVAYVAFNCFVIPSKHSL